MNHFKSKNQKIKKSNPITIKLIFEPALIPNASPPWPNAS